MSLEEAFDEVDDFSTAIAELVTGERETLRAERLERDRPAFLKFVRQHRQRRSHECPGQ